MIKDKEYKKRWREEHKSNCIDCGKEINYYSIKCRSCSHKGKMTMENNSFYGKHHTEETKKNMSITRKGRIPWNKGLSKELQPFFNKNHSEKTKKDMSVSRLKRKEELGYIISPEARKNMSISRLGKKLSKEHCKNISLGHKGEKSYNWQGGISFEPYGVEFNKQLKEQIRKRDNYRCQQCFREQDELRTKTNRKYKLMIHHINYDKKNNNPLNLISLCRKCHLQTNFKREDWTKYFNNKINGGNKNEYKK